MKHIKTFEQMNNTNDIITKVSLGGTLIIGFRGDIESNKTSLMDGYRTGTIHIGRKEIENKGTTYFSSNFHGDQVISDDDYTEEDMIEEMDFTYHPRISDEIINQKLEEIVSKDYSDSKIVKTYYH